MTFKEFALQLEALETTAARLKITALLADLLKQLSSEKEIEVACYLLQGGLTPPYQSLEFQLSTKLVLRVLARLGEKWGWSATGSLAPSGLFEAGQIDYLFQIDQRYHQLGDLGVLAAEVAATKKVEFLELPTVTTVYDLLVSIARAGGEGSQEQKQVLLMALLNQLGPTEAKFAIRIILGRLRLGFSTLTLMDALSWAKYGDKRDRVELELAYQKKADIGKLAATYLSDKSAQSASLLAKYQIEIGVPVVPALCQRLNSAQEIIEKMPEVYAEPKYDGLRIQIHFDVATGLVKAYTRNLDEVTSMLPELQDCLKDLKCQSCILDSEAVGYDPVTGKTLPFQETITRKRKHEVATQAASVPIKCFVFDVMAIDGQSLVDTPLSQRKKLLAEVFVNSKTLMLTEFFQTNQADELKIFHEAQLAAGLEGAVIKQVDSIYRSGRKGWRWVKIKEKEGTSGKLSDTVDCVVMGYYLGRGKRTAFGVGAWLLGVISEIKGELKVLSLAKLGTGLTDIEFKSLRIGADVSKVAVQPEEYVVPAGLKPDVWLRPALVLEIAADEITKSPMHAAGVSLRFPRLVKIRTDKNWQQATSLIELAEIQIQA